MYTARCGIIRQEKPLSEGSRQLVAMQQLSERTRHPQSYATSIRPNQAPGLFLADLLRPGAQLLHPTHIFFLLIRYSGAGYSVCRNWLPISFWLLDTTIINSHLIPRQAIPHPPRSAMYFHSQSHFRIHYTWNLVHSGFQAINPSFARQIQTEINHYARGCHCPGATPLGNTTEARRAGYVGKNYNFSPTHFTPGSHSLQLMEKHSCPSRIFHRYLSKSPSRATLFNYGPQGKIRRTSFQCSFSKAPLCCGFCFDMYHNY